MISLIYYNMKECKMQGLNLNGNKKISVQLLDKGGGERYNESINYIDGNQGEGNSS